MHLEIDIEDWPAGDWEVLATRAADATARIAPELANPRLVASMLFTTDDVVRTLNHDWRQKDKPTNVLSFPMLERGDLVHLDPDEDQPEMLGDIALAGETCAREAAEKSVTLEHHAAHLIVHGLLHLAGFDHETGEADAQEMEEMEVKALALMGIANPYTGDQTA
ncbi:rRNA maturation RNase YbeY [Aurantiacibacter marinus]|uniref:Endoribonuclease YbeY n=1 Tax=Aurantiacibacter marinus TaxID=874156 RepID=A0A0H0XN98_9SPHN|nr:rRNA maturation RNase YbeY [Aurantiacibacter marinus]KLI63491.1 rRNA maturation factor [Aurantiacibacter marinus]